jgi:hypothetical protein
MPRISNFFIYFKNKILPSLPVGALQITDSSIQFLYYKGNNATSTSLNMPPGIIEDGRIKNQSGFISALREVRNRILSNPKKTMHVVLVLPIRDVYIQPIILPLVADADLNEVADLNMRISSPTDINQSYYDWQRIVEDKNPSNQNDQIRLLGAFVSRSVVDEFINSLTEVNFGVAAIEFWSLSIARDVCERGISQTPSARIVAEITGEGISFMISKAITPYFHYFKPWEEIQGNDKTISLEKFQSVFKEELRRIINYYSTHFEGEKINTIIIITPFIASEIESFVRLEFKEFEKIVLNPQNLSAIGGAALRGQRSRQKDQKEISLTSISAMEFFENDQTLNFIRIWRNIFLTVFGFMLAVFAVTNVLFERSLTKTIQNQSVLITNVDAQELQTLKDKADMFNQAVEKISQFRAKRANISALLRKIDDLSMGSIIIQGINFQSVDLPSEIIGVTVNEKAAVDFKNRLSEQPQFTDVELPFGNITTSGGRVLFNITLKIASLNFQESSF